MKKYLKYFKYLFWHKWYVFVECLKFGLIWQGVIHDWSKVLPDELIAYANYFYGGDKRKDRFYTPSQGTYEFNVAWLKHQHRNPHHWQSWLLKEDSGKEFALKMPKKYVYEMICDWRGAGRAQGFNDTLGWYKTNKEKMILHPETRALVEQLLGEDAASEEDIYGDYQGFGTNIMDKFMKECPPKIVKESLVALDGILDQVTRARIKEEHKKDPKTWWAFYHHGWGTAVRNALRDKVCLDKELPSGNWDDYYIQIIEIYLGLRELNVKK
jgi:hypothetical protein